MNEDSIIAAFAILECEPGCSPDEVKASYRQLVKVWHPDRFHGDEKLKVKATEKMKAINEAYGLLESFFKDVERINELDRKRTSSDKTKRPASSTRQDGHGQADENPNPSKGETTFRIVSCKKETLKTGEIFYRGVIEEIINSEGCPVITKRSDIATALVAADVSFEKASRQSMAFFLPAELVSCYKQYCDGVDDSWVNRKYDFPDKSVIYKHSNRPTYTWKSNQAASPKMSDLQETYSVLKQKSNWRLCAELAQWAIEQDCKNPWGWIQQSDMLLRQGRKREAFDALKNAAAQLPDEIVIFYNLARYAALLGNQLEAVSFLKSVFQLAAREGPNSGTFQRYREMVLEDSSLICVHNFVPQLPFFWKVRKQFGF